MTCLPAATGKFQSCSPQRSVAKMSAAVPAGTVASRGTVPPQSAALPPLTRLRVGGPVRTAVAGLQRRTRGVDAVEHVAARSGGALGHEQVVGQRGGRRRRARWCRRPAACSATRPWVSPPILVVSLPTHSPWLVAKSAWAPTPAGPAGVPRQRQPVDRVERGDALPGHRAGTGLVALEGVVQPAHVAADVDGAAGDRDAVRRVAAGVVRPGRVVAGAGGLPAGDGVAHRPAAGAAGERAGGRHHEVGRRPGRSRCRA